MEHDLKQGRPGHHYCARCGREFEDAGPDDKPVGGPLRCPGGGAMTDEDNARDRHIESLRGQVDELVREVKKLQNNLKMTDAVGAMQELANALKPLVDWIQEVRESIRETGGCDECEEGIPSVVTEAGAGLVHFADGEVAECENSVLQEIYRRGLISPEVYTRCEAGHDWFGSGCPMCNPEEEA